MLLYQVAVILKAVAGLGAFVALVHFLLTQRWASLAMGALFGLGFFWPGSSGTILKVFGPTLGSRLIPNNKTGLVFYAILVLIPVAYYLYTDLILPRTGAAPAAATEGAAPRGGRGRRRRKG